jgi:uncharacterized protein (DUF983 family)
MNQPAPSAQPSRATVVARGFTRRCPRCGSGKIFRHWTKIADDCPRCGLHFERESGYWAGALAVNFVCVGGLMILVLAATLVATLPDVNVVLTLGLILPVALLGPIVWYPFSKTIWMAIDRAFLQRMDRYERPDE